MFEVKKDEIGISSRVEYPLTTAHAHQFVYINGFSHYLIGDSEVKCDEGDKFESAFGKELAETNATIDMLKEYKKVLIKFTKQPEWRKEKPESLGFKLSDLTVNWAPGFKYHECVEAVKEKTYYGINEAQLYRGVSKLLQMNGIDIVDL